MCVLKQSGESLDLEIRFLLKSVFLSRYKQIVDDMIIQTDKNASDIDVENIVNRKVSLSVLVLAHFGLISIYFAGFFSFLSAFSRGFFTQFFFRWKLLLTRAARTPFLKITMAEASALQR